MLDWITWGKPFGAFIYYVKFNVIEGKAAAWGVDPFGYYAHNLWLSTGWTLAIVYVGLALAVFRARMLLLICVAYFLAHSYVPHKELRFIMPIVPLALTVSAIGLGTALSWIRWRSWRFDGHVGPAWALAAVLCALMMKEAPGETFEKMGYLLGPTKGQSSPWHSEEDANFILWGASVKKDVCGMILTGANPIATGGFSATSTTTFRCFSGGRGRATDGELLRRHRHGPARPRVAPRLHARADVPLPPRRRVRPRATVCVRPQVPLTPSAASQRTVNRSKTGGPSVCAGAGAPSRATHPIANVSIPMR